MDVRDLDIAQRAKNVLIAAGIHNLDDLARFTCLELAKLPNCGARTLTEIVDAAKQHGLALRDPEKTMERLRGAGSIVSGKKGGGIRVVFQSPDGSIHPNVSAARRHNWEVEVKKGLQVMFGDSETANVIFQNRLEILTLLARKPGRITMKEIA